MVREKSFRIRDSHLFVREAGSGFPVLLLHGNPDSSDVWDDVIPHLSEDYRCITPDLPGLGRSKAPPDFDFSFENLGRVVEEIVDALGVSTPLHLVAHDFGGAFGMAWAVLRPDRVRTITIINHP
ncbi:MAG: alpha/beta fold hydrolase, partial [Rhodothermales bacterium]|nr:alpha/beta fold hydrolase [Rhodothermales bacterium]